MLKLLKNIKAASRIISAAVLFSFFVGFVFYSTISSYDVPYRHQIQKDDNVSKHYTVSHQKAIKKSRQSAVQLLSIEPSQGLLSTFTGTYFESFGSYFVITVAHGIQGPCENTKVVYLGEFYDI